MPYEPNRIEARWQAYWREHQTFRVEIDPAKPKYYVLDMFPYPSGDGLHVGHPEGYTATDILARYKRMRGFNVLHPMGWDAFGLPAEQYAIETGTHPRDTTRRNIERFRTQIEALGFSYDWSREIDTTDPSYVRWTQWIFQRLFEAGLAYRAEVPVNWCPALGTVLANEEVIDGKSERGGHPVVRVPMKQWMLRITAYADRLLEDLEDLDWPEPIKKMQRDWIGRSEGAEVRFPLPDAPGEGIDVFTTRPDTLFGATYMVLAPEHDLVERITTPEQRTAVEAYVEESRRKSERIRTADNRAKTGVDTGAFALNPCNGQRIPVWIADYVLATYGTGAIMAVPAHDERDHEFAATFGLEIRKVVEVPGQELPTTADGVATASEFLDGLETSDAKRRMIEWLESEGHGKGTVTYKLRDWLFSRQRYWGEPFPVIHTGDTTELVPDDTLPLVIPELDDFRPTGEQETPLERVRDWIETTHPVTGAPAAPRRQHHAPVGGELLVLPSLLRPPQPGRAHLRRGRALLDARGPLRGRRRARGAPPALRPLLAQVPLRPGRGAHCRTLPEAREPGDDPRRELSLLRRQPHRRHRRGRKDVHRRASAGRRGGGLRRWKTAASSRRAGWAPQRSREGPAPERRPIHPTIPDLPLEEVVEKMSKSRGNVINPDDVVGEYGADSMRLYEMFIGPLDKDAPWSTEGIQGVYRFLQRTWRLFHEEDAGGVERVRALPAGPAGEEAARLVAQTVQGVTDDLDAMQFNTAISKLMVFVRDVGKEASLDADTAATFLQLLAPFAPHLAEELWARTGHDGTITYEPWPVADPALLTRDTIVLAVQVNGKRRDEIEVPADAEREAIEATALASEAVQRHLDGRAPKKVIVVPGRLVNVVG